MTVTTTAFTNQEESSLKVHSSRSVKRAKVMPDGKNLVGHAGAALLAELADRSGPDRGHVTGHGRVWDLLAHP